MGFFDGLSSDFMDRETRKALVQQLVAERGLLRSSQGTFIPVVKPIENVKTLERRLETLKTKQLPKGAAAAVRLATQAIFDGMILRVPVDTGLLRQSAYHTVPVDRGYTWQAAVGTEAPYGGKVEQTKPYLRPAIEEVLPHLPRHLSSILQEHLINYIVRGR